MTTGPGNPSGPPGGPSGPTGPGRTALRYRPTFRPDAPTPAAVPNLEWVWGHVGGTWTAQAVGRTYVIGHNEDRWWWATVDGVRLADPDGNTVWGLKTAAQYACGQHVRDNPAARDE